MTENGWGSFRENSGREPGFVSELRKTGYKTRVARIPTHWDVEDINGGLEHILSIVCRYEQEIVESARKSGKGAASNRFWKLAECLEQLKSGFPRSYFEKHRWKKITEID